MRKRTEIFALSLVLLLMAFAPVKAQAPPASVIAIKAGRLIDPETGTTTTGAVIIVEGEKIKAVGANLAIPAGATVIDLSKLAVLCGSNRSLRRSASRHRRFAQRSVCDEERNGLQTRWCNDAREALPSGTSANTKRQVDSLGLKVIDTLESGAYAQRHHFGNRESRRLEFKPPYATPRQ